MQYKLWYIFPVAATHRKAFIIIYDVYECNISIRHL